MFRTDMTTHTPTPAERFIILKGELRLRLDARGARHGIAGVVDVLVGALLMGMLSAFARLAERRSRQQAIRDGAGGELECIGAAGGFAAVGGDGCGDRWRDADAPDAGRRVAGGALVAAAGSVLVCDGVTDESCIQDEGGVAVASEQPPSGPRYQAANLAEMGWANAVLGRGRRLLEGPFAKMELRTKVELHRNRFDNVTLVDCCRE